MGSGTAALGGFSCPPGVFQSLACCPEPCGREMKVCAEPSGSPGSSGQGCSFRANVAVKGNTATPGVEVGHAKSGGVSALVKNPFQKIGSQI